MILSQNPRAYEFLLEGIASARSADELARMRRLAHAHYSGALLRELEATIEVHSRALDTAAPPARRRDPRLDDQESSAVPAHDVQT